jgi:hypothetical protein
VTRATVYTPQIAEEICERIMMGESLRAICRDDHMPHMATICRWLASDREEFREAYYHARRVQAELYADDIMAIADDLTGDVQRDRLRVDSRKWIASKLLVGRYGDRVTQEHVGAGGGPIQTITRRIIDPASGD